VSATAVKIRQIQDEVFQTSKIFSHHSTMQSTSDKWTLTYFPVYGKAEVIRLAFAIAKVPLEEVFLTKEEFPELKASGKLPFRQLPILEYNGEVLAQSTTILRFVCQKFGLYPTDPKQAYAVEAIVAQKLDVSATAVKIRQIQDEVERKKGLEDFYAGDLVANLKLIEAFYKKHTGGNGYFVGDKMSMADIAMIDFYTRFITHPSRKEIGQTAIEQVPELQKYFETRVQDFKSYLETRPQRDF